MDLVRKDRKIVLLIAANLFASIGMGILSLGVAWLIVDRHQGEKILGMVMIATTVLLFISSPYIGVMIDRLSRKLIFQCNQWLVLVVVTPIALFGLMNQGLHTWQLVILYVTSIAYYGIHYPNLMAFVQQLFDRGRHNRLNSLLEVQSQSASMIAGGVAGFLFQLIEPSQVLLLIVVSTIISLGLISKLPDGDQFKNGVRSVHRIKEGKAGLAFIKGNLKVCVSIFALMIPFLTLMVGNYLRPVYINSTLQADASIYGFTNMFYSVGAICAGLIISMIFARFGPWIAAIVSVGMYTASLFLVAFIPVVQIFLILQVFHGLGNAGSRICKQNMMMATIPNDRIGRVNGIFEAVGMGIRVILLLTFTYTMDWIHVEFAFLITALLSLCAFLMVLKNRTQLSSYEKTIPLVKTSGGA
ncbi:MFS transporter [Alkalicoccobacillus murimartini]|uniref:MFS family permease n=1 Tax=Alkalicoccobacillus murimartini TaxID=171685 RepID=A0ABT9YIH7_9BACI|nr:MFS transporter [Alkalicoccobacillus murimartini]MDQ0207632.1 MFS family permease [Alkalicoccobacillus murimartini]